MRHARLLVVVAALTVVAGCTGTVTESRAPDTTVVRPTESAAPTPSTDAPADFTCLQLVQAYTGAYDMGMRPEVWITGVLTSLLRADGVTAGVDGAPLARFTTALRTACGDPAVSHVSARDIGAKVYAAAKASYRPVG